MSNGTGGAVNITLTSDSQLLQDYLQTSGILVNTQNAGAGQVASLQNAQGQAEAVVIGQDGGLYHVCREKLSDSGWNMYGIGSGFQTIGAIDAATVWASGNNGNIWRNDRGRWTESLPPAGGRLASAISVGTDGTVWSLANGSLCVMKTTGPLTPPTANTAISPLLILDADNLLNFFCVDTAGGLWTIRQTAVQGGWGPWTSLGAPASGVTLALIAVAPNQDGRLQVFAIGSDQQHYSLWQLNETGHPWSAWGNLGPLSAGITTLVVGQNSDGRLEVFVLSQPDGNGNVTLLHTWQTAPNAGWAAWSALTSAPGISSLTVGTDAAGLLNVVYGTSQYPFVFTWSRQSPGGGWNNWLEIGGGNSDQVLSAPQLASNGNGSLVLFAMSNGLLVYMNQLGTDWSDQWFELWTSSPGPLTVVRNADQRLEVFFLVGSQAWHFWQTTPGGAFTGAAALSPAGISLASIAATCDAAGNLEFMGLGAGNGYWLIAQNPNAEAYWTGAIGNWWQCYPVPNAPPLKRMPAGTVGDFWAIDTGENLRHWDGANWTEQALPGGLPAACLTYDPEGALWIIAADASGTLLQLTNGSFTQMPGNLPGAHSIAGSSGFGLWATAAASAGEFALHCWSNDGWQTVGSPNLANMDWNNLPSVSVGQDGAVWVLDGSGNLWRQSLSDAAWSWKPSRVPGVRMQSVSAVPGGGAWAIDTEGAIWRNTGRWTRTADATPEAAIVEIGASPSGALLGVDRHGSAHSYTRRTGWRPFAAQLPPGVVQLAGAWAATQHALYRQRPGGWEPAAVWDDISIRQISVGSGDAIAVLDTGGNLHVPPGARPAWADHAPGNLVQIGVMNARRMWGIARDPAGTGYKLHLYDQEAWRPLHAADWLFRNALTEPRLSSAADGTVWLLDTSAVPRVLSWSPREQVWAPQDQPIAMQSVAAENVNAGSITTAQQQAAWGVTADGAFRRNTGAGWTETFAALPNGATAARISVGADGSIWAVDTGGALYRQQPWSDGPVTAGDGSAAIVTGQDGAGALHACCLDINGAPWVLRKTPGANTWASGVQLTGPTSFAGLASGTTAAGNLNLFCLTGSGAVYLTFQDPASSSGWAGFAALGQPPGITLTGLVTGRDQGNRLNVFGLGGDGSAWFIVQQQSAPTGWSGWTALPAASGVSLAALGGTGTDPGGTLEVFALGSDGAAYHIWQQANQPNGWPEWYPLGAAGLPAGVTLSGLTAANQPNGPIVVIGCGSDRATYAMNGDPSSPSGWSGWTSIGTIDGARPLSLVTAPGAGGSLTAFAPCSDGAIHAVTLAPSGAADWGTWAPLGASATDGALMSVVAAATGPDGVTHVLTCGAGCVWQTRPQASAASGWGDWGRLAGVQCWTPCGTGAVAQAPVGSADALWAVFADGSLRTSNGGTAWTEVALPNGAPVSVSVGTDGTVWAVTSTECFCYAGGSWTLAGGNSFAQAPVGSANDLWSLDSAGDIWRSGDGGGNWRLDTSFGAGVRQLSACADGSIWLIAANGGASLAQGWERLMRPTGMPGFPSVNAATEVVAGLDERGTQHLFFVQNGVLFHTYELDRHGWVEPNGLTPANVTLAGIGLTRQQDTGELIVYCAPADNTITWATRSPGDPYAFACSSLPVSLPDYDTAGSAIELVAASADGWYWFITDSNSNLYVNWTIEDRGFLPLLLEPSASFAQFVRLPWDRPADTPHFGFVDGSDQLWIAQIIGVGEYDAFANALQLTGAATLLPNGVTNPAALLQADYWTPPQPRIFAMGQNTQTNTNDLWMLCRIDRFQSPVSAAAWSGWTPVGGQYSSLAGGPGQAGSDTLFTISDASLNWVRQNPMTGVWTDGLAKRPSYAGVEVEPVSMYQTEATFTDQNNIPQANLSVTVFAATPVEAWINSTLYYLDPVHGVTVPTNPFGKLTIKTAATRLHTPDLMFNAVGLGGAGAARGFFQNTGVSITPSQNINDFLRGSGCLRVGGGAPTKLSGPTLQGLQPSLTSTGADALVSNFATLYTMSGGNPGAARQLAGAMIFHPLPGGFFSHLFDDIKKAAELIVHAVEKGLVSAVTELGDGVVKLTLYIGSAVGAVIQMAIHTVEDAVRAIELIVMKVIDALKSFIEWLMLLLDFGNMLKTQQAIMQLVNSSVGILAAQIGSVEAAVSALFGSLTSNVKTEFAQLIGQGSAFGYQTFGSLPSSTASGQPGAAPAARLAGAAQPVPNSSAVQNNWFLNKVLDHILPSITVPAIAGLDMSAFLDAFHLQNVLNEVQSAGAALLKFVESLVTNPQSFVSQGITDLLAAAEDLVLAILGLIEGLIEAFLDIGQIILGGLLEALQGAVDIPVIGALFSALTGEDLTLLTLSSMVVAVPLYILYDLLFGGLPFDGLLGEVGAAEGRTKTEVWASLFMVNGIVDSGIGFLADCFTVLTGPTPTDFMTPFSTMMFRKLFASLLAVGGIVGRGCSWPGGFPALPQGSVPEGQQLAWTNWGLYWIAPLYSLVALPFSLPPDLAQAVKLMSGSGALGTGLADAFVNPTVNAAAGVKLALAPFPLLFSYTLLSEVRQSIFDSTAVDPAIVNVIVDLLVNIADSVLQEIAANT